VEQWGVCLSGPHYLPLSLQHEVFNHDEDSPKDMLDESKEFFAVGKGTTVVMQIAVNSERNAGEVIRQFTNTPEDFDFSRTVVPMKLATLGDEQLVSRSQAKRLIVRFDRFKTVILNFEGVREIGQAFADELFRVYANAHPDVDLIPENMTDPVKQMWRRAIAD
jgi:hypothetical protein